MTANELVKYLYSAEVCLVCMSNLCFSSLKALLLVSQHRNCKNIQWLFCGQCSVTCGDGIRRRAVTCMDSSLGTPTDKEHCPKAIHIATEEFCRQPICASWRVGDWKPCSVSCGKVLISLELAVTVAHLCKIMLLLHNTNEMHLCLCHLRPPENLSV